MRLTCRLLGHATEPRRDRQWYPTWRCTRCGADLRAKQVATFEGNGGTK